MDVFEPKGIVMPVPCCLLASSMITHTGGTATMARFLHHIFTGLQRKAGTVCLALFWSAGLFAGFIFYRNTGNSSVSLMCGALNCAVSIVSLLSVILLPFLLSAFAVYFSRPYLLLVIAFVKAFSLAFVSAGLNTAFGAAGWLAQLLLMFSDCCTVPILWLYWLRYGEKSCKFSLKGTFCTIFVVCMVGFFDFYFVSPIPAML